MHVSLLVALNAADADPAEHFRHVLSVPANGNSSYAPWGHGWHPSALDEAKNPAVHAKQLEAPAFDASPASQDSHAAAPGAENFPVGHWEHPLELFSPCTDEADPAGHSTHSPLPDCSLNHPVRHAEQASPSAAVNPGRHLHWLMLDDPEVSVVDM